ncbi:family 9 carbohydrate esterase [Trichoderma citrinoviride]|uniref:Family 9 carbohydrate esterase n=1 Tax=Trichoderma citrinoviride TaxID=58853 RepID=A0A2T4B7H9_9HYPO|nr:family 9 carbohydrate esterase [Trichoderma citrinoviride]PTB65260.1 family 9 carbohydrate esterase [Trichoderma citrinoviride]
MDEKARLPPYSASGLPLPASGAAHVRGRRAAFRRSRVLKLFGATCLTLLVVGQWTQIWRDDAKAPLLSLDKLNNDLQICQKLRHKPQDPIGLGRDKNARWIPGSQPTLIKNATIWIGEPVEGTSEADARAGKGWEWIQGDVLLEHGLIKRVESHISSQSLPKDTQIFDAAGRQLTTGIIDMHSHAGVDSLPFLRGYADTNEVSDDITPWARSIDAINTFDPQIEVIKSGGVTTSLILPGSGNSMGGEAFTIKHAVGPKNGRTEISAQDLLADPDRNWRFMKMACGENPKRVHGGVDKRPFSRMGESFNFRHAFEQARALIQRQDDWCDKADAVGVENMEEYLPQEIFWESLAAALRGQVHINTHCYTVTDLEAMVDHTNEFKFPIRAFHHAHQTYLATEILKRTYGGRPPASALFADNMYYKTESYIASEHAAKYLYDANLTTVFVSDNPVLNAQHVLFEAAKGYHYGLPYHAALSAVTSLPAELLGFGNRLGKVKPGFDADIVVWDSDPLSVGAAPVQVWIDGTAQFESPVELQKPKTGPIVPDEALANIIEEPTEIQDVVFHGITKVLLADDQASESNGEPVDVFVSRGKIACIGPCSYEYEAAAKAAKVHVQLSNGYLTNSFTGVAGTIGLNDIDGEDVTDNGPNPVAFSRAVDGLRLDSKKLNVAAKYGVTKAISAPKYLNGKSHHGVSVGFLTAAKTVAEKGAVFDSDVAVHYTLDLSSRNVGSYSELFGLLRRKLLAAASQDKPAEDPYSEVAYLQKVVAGESVLALTIDNADGIATALRIKAEVEEATSSKIKLAILGGSESHLVAAELAAAKVGVILLPLQAHPNNWDQRRSLPGAPLSNGTTIDYLLDAGVTVAIGLPEDWVVRDLGFEAGTAYHNGNGRLSEKTALDLVSVNVHKILGGKLPEAQAKGHFIVSEGSPLEIGSRIKAVGAGRDKVAVFQ